MCDPILIAGIALSAGSMVANQVATGEQTRARDSVLAAERMRQNSFDQQASALNTQSQDRYVGFESQQATRAQQIGDYLHTDVGDPNSTASTVMPSSSSNVVNQESAKQHDNAQGFVDQQTGATAALRSFGDLLGDTSRLQARDASHIAQIGGFKQGSNNVVPLELDQAATAGDNWKLLADLLAGGGQIATGAGINGTGSGALTKMFGNSTTDPIGTMPKFSALQNFRLA